MKRSLYRLNVYFISITYALISSLSLSETKHGTKRFFSSFASGGRGGVL